MLKTKAENEEQKRQIQALEDECARLKQQAKEAEAKVKQQTLQRPAEKIDLVTAAESDKLLSKVGQLETRESELKGQLVTATRKNQEAAAHVQALLVKRYKMTGDEGPDGRYELSATLKKQGYS